MNVPHISRRRSPVALAVGLAIIAMPGGCTFFRMGETEDPHESEHPMLAAARANRLTMFGDLAGFEGSTYFTRGAVSLRQHTFAEVGADSDVDVAPGGSRIVFASTRHHVNPDLYVKSIDGVAVTQLTSDPGSDIQPAFSPDGRRVAFASDRSGQWDIWTMSVDGGQPIRVTDGAADEVHPSWSPDGSKLVYCSLPPSRGQWELWVTQPQSGGSRVFIGYGLFPVWSPVGDTILYQRARERGDRKFSVWALTLVDGEPRNPTEITSGAHTAFILPAWSSDGSQIAYSSVTAWPAGVAADGAARTAYDIWIMSADGRGQARLTDGHSVNFAPAFSTDGRIFFTSDRAGRDSIWSLLPSGEAGGAAKVERVTATPLQSTGQAVIGSDQWGAANRSAGGS